MTTSVVSFSHPCHWHISLERRKGQQSILRFIIIGDGSKRKKKKKKEEELHRKRPSKYTGGTSGMVKLDNMNLFTLGAFSFTALSRLNVPLIAGSRN